MHEIFPAVCATVADTIELGRTIAAGLKAGDVVALSGEPGSGKTHLSKGICEGLGVDPRSVSSPTYTIVNEYRGSSGRVCHMDLYRLDSIAQFEDLDPEQYFDGSSIVIIEWPELIEMALPDSTLALNLLGEDQSGRRIEIR